MRYYGKPIVETIEHRKFEYLRCDKCANKIEGSYYEVTTGHHDWGNDSCDSVRCYDICPDCIQEFTENYLKNNIGTEYIEIERQRAVHHLSYYREYDKYDSKHKLAENDNKGD